MKIDTDTIAMTRAENFSFIFKDRWRGIKTDCIPISLEMLSTVIEMSDISDPNEAITPRALQCQLVNQKYLFVQYFKLSSLILNLVLMTPITTR